jgi:outer membrane protein TolC
MDIPEMAAEQEIATEPERAAEQEEQPEEEEEYEEGITLRASDLLHFQDTLMDIRSQIADLQRDARQDRLEIQGMFRAILDRLPPASGPSAPPPAP